LTTKESDAWGSLQGAYETHIRTIDGFKVGFFGVTTHECRVLSYPGPSISLFFHSPFPLPLPILFLIVADIEFLPVIETSKKAVEQLKAEGAEVIVALTHQSFSEDFELAKKVIFCFHSSFPHLSLPPHLFLPLKKYIKYKFYIKNVDL
jgi:hypothetical protein